MLIRPEKICFKGKKPRPHSREVNYTSPINILTVPQQKVGLTAHWKRASAERIFITLVLNFSQENLLHVALKALRISNWITGGDGLYSVDE